MKQLMRLSMLAALVCSLALPALASPAQAASSGQSLAKVEAVGCPILRLEHWQRSTTEEKMAFLLGFASMLELEKEWQYTPSLPLSQSTVGSWVRGLDGVTLGDMCRALDTYAARNPDKLDRSVLETLGIIYVKPKLTPAERTEAAERVRIIRQNR